MTEGSISLYKMHWLAAQQNRNISTPIAISSTGLVRSLMLRPSDHEGIMIVLKCHLDVNVDSASWIPSRHHCSELCNALLIGLSYASQPCQIISHIWVRRV